MKRIPGSGNRHPRVFIVGERPGPQEHTAGVAFVGDAGEELWSRLWRIAKIERADCWVTNLVQTFSMEPPTAAEIARDAPLLRAELRAIRPAVIFTVGYHAGRWFLPQFADWPGDYWHGLPYVTPRCKGAIVVPACHSAAALRQADRYQEQFTTDCEALRAILRAVAAGRPVEPHAAAPAAPAQVGLASIPGHGVTGLDTEGWLDDPQAVSLSSDGDAAACVELPRGLAAACASAPVRGLRLILPSLPAVAIHHAKHDLGILARLELDSCLDLRRVHDTMLQASLLGLPQSLKVLAYRRLHLLMPEYEELVQPLDDRIVRQALQEAHAHAQETWRTVEAGDTRRGTLVGGRGTGDGHQRAPGQDPVRKPDRAARAEAQAEKAAARRAAKAALARRKARAESRFPKRGLTALSKVLAATDAVDSLRTRWGRSKFAPRVPLPAPATWRDVPQPGRIDYAMVDAVAHRRLHEDLWPQVVADGCAPVYRLVRGVLPFLVRNEQVGMAVDEAGLRSLSTLFEADYARTCAAINELAGREVNPLASEDISDTIFNDWGVTPTRITKTGFYTTQDKYLKARKGEHEGVSLIITARQLSKLLGTYTRRLPTLLRDGRYYPDWKYTRTTSGRPAESIILLIPKHDPTAKAERRVNRAKAIRGCFKADPDCVLVSCDLGQIELRVFAHLTQEPIMLKAYERGEDLHAKTAHELLGAPKRKQDQDESAHRLPAKTLNFGILMGMTEYGLCDQLQEQGQSMWQVDELTRELQRQGFKSTTEFRREWFALYKHAARWVEQQKAYAHKHGYVTTMNGRKVRLSGIWSSSDRLVAEFERKAHAIPVQGSAIEIAQEWLARVWRYTIAPRLRETGITRRHCEPWVWVHDDVTLCVDRRLPKTIAKEILAAVPQRLCIPVTADAKAGLDWGHMDDLPLA